ncbi:Dbl homology domain-containing protein [Dichotomocladium elegans]|nr:Dbl homology domain-containing protein [Dichotomocladium elegans]
MELNIRMHLMERKLLYDKLLVILRISNRRVASQVGRALGRLGLFHDVTYEHLLLDESSEIYQFDEHLFVPTIQDSQSPRSSDECSSRDLSEPSSPTSLDPYSDLTPNPVYDGEGSCSGGIIPALSGVFTELTHCYSPTCITSREPCYSILCPKRKAHKLAQRSREASTLSITSTSSLFDGPGKLWRDTAPAEVRDTISVSEWKRQEAIFELVSTEANFVRVLNYLIQMWIEPIQASEEIIPDPRRRNILINSVFANIPMLYDVHRKLLRALEKRQKEHPIVQRIGDVMLKHVYDFEPFIQYGASRHISKFAFEHEQMTNGAFASFVAVGSVILENGGSPYVMSIAAQRLSLTTNDPRRPIHAASRGDPQTHTREPSGSRDNPKSN